MQIVPIRTKKLPPSGRRAQQRAENRRVILDAARRVFAEKGLSATRIRDIIRRRRSLRAPSTTTSVRKKKYFRPCATRQHKHWARRCGTPVKRQSPRRLFFWPLSTVS